MIMQDQCDEMGPEKLIYTRIKRKGVLVTNTTHNVSTIIIFPFSIYNRHQQLIPAQGHHIPKQYRKLAHVIHLQLPTRPSLFCGHAHSYTHTECCTGKSSQADPRLPSYTEGFLLIGHAIQINGFLYLSVNESTMAMLCAYFQRMLVCHSSQHIPWSWSLLMGISGTGCFTLVFMTHAGRNK